MQVQEQFDPYQLPLHLRLPPEVVEPSGISSSVASPPATTDPPASDPPATDPPVSDPPATTDPPASDPLASDPPASDPPASEPPTTELPATEPPAIAPPATASPATAPPTRHELAVEGNRVNIAGDFGVVFKATDNFVAVAYDDLSWEWMTHETFGEGAFQELTLADQARALHQLCACPCPALTPHSSQCEPLNSAR